MPDTGAPYFIPFADPTDLVRDWPALSEDVAEAVADGLDEAGNAGIGSNVVQTVKTDTFSTTSASFTAVTGLSVTITPSSATSKVLIVAQISPGVSGEPLNAANFRLSGGNTSGYVGDAAGSRVRATMSVGRGRTDWPLVSLSSGLTISFLDSPGTASAVTYEVEVNRGGAGTAFVNRSGEYANNAGASTMTSSITVIEVAA